MDASPTEHRLRMLGPRLRRQLVRLYGGPAAQALWPRIETLLRARAGERPTALVALDAARLADPDWFVAPDMLGYSTYVDRFAGTVDGLTAKVGHLEALGVRYLHLLALLKARAGDSDGGFAVADYLAVEPRLGTMADVERLAARLREGRISLCVDLALNHTADDHHWAQAAKAGDPHYRAFYHVVSAAEAERYEADLRQIFPTTAPGNFTPVAAMGGCVWTTFYPFQWDLNWANPEVMLAIVDTMLRLANHGFEAFRLDSIAFLWKQQGTDCRNLPHAHHIVRALRAALDIVAPATLLKAEAIVPTAFVPPYFGADDGADWDGGFEPECHLVYNNSLMVAGWVALAEQSAALPDAIVRASGGLPRGANWLSYARCHDDIGWGAVIGDLAGIDADPVARLKAAARFVEGGDGSWARGEPFQSDGSVLHGSNGMMASLAGLEAADDDEAREMAYRRIALLSALAIASGGLATTYMGDEAGLLNDRGYLADPERAHEGRWLHRPDMDWQALGTPAARRIAGDLAALRAARIAGGGAGAPAAIATGAAAVLGIACGGDRVFLNFSGEAVAITLDAPGCDRLDGVRWGRMLFWDPGRSCGRGRRHDAAADGKDMSMTKARLSLVRLIEMNLGFLGLQFSFGLQQANMAPIYGYLGADEASLPLLWLAGPVTGLLVQPLIGAMSDRTSTRIGRRTPYFLVGAVLCSLCLLAMPYSPTLWVAASLLWVLDAANNVTMEPYRAYVGDRLLPEQRAAGFLTQSAFTGLAQTLSYLAPSLLVWIGFDKDAVDANGIPDITRVAFLIGAVLSLTTILWSVVRVPELPLPADEQARLAADPLTLRGALRDLWQAIVEMPRPMRQLALAMLCQWYAMFAYWQFITFAVARSLYGTTDARSAAFRDSVLTVGQLGAFYNAVAFVAALALVPAARRWGAKHAHAACLLASGVAMLAIPGIAQEAGLFVAMLGIGVGWASMMGNPYVMLVDMIPPERNGVYMGIFNMFIVIPMIVESLSVPLIYHSLLAGDPRNILYLAGTLMVLGAAATLLVGRSGRPEHLVT